MVGDDVAMRTALAAALIAVTACSSNYVPRTPGRVFVTLDGGMPSYVRDGQSYRHGFLGGGLREAVRGNRQAERAADEYHDHLRDGLLIMLLGGVCSGTALGMAIADVDQDGDAGPHTSTKLLVALGCSVAMMGGALYTASAEPYRWDAINIFNDAPPPAPMWAPPPGTPGYQGSTVVAPARKRLGMR